MQFLIELKSRNELLFYFGAFNLILALIFIILSQITFIQVAGTNAWFKPIKFALSIGIYTWSIAWFSSYLPQDRLSNILNWLIVVMLGFEIIYIGLQAGRGQMSHFNLSTPLYSILYGLMAMAATVVSIITLIIAFRFFASPFPDLPNYYLWSIRLGLIIFFIFSMEGFVMGANLTHTIGSDAPGKVIPFLNWSRQYGDPRVAHFIGMHALQILPLASFYMLKDTKLVIGLALLYTVIAVYVLLQALYGKPFINY